MLQKYIKSSHFSDSVGYNYMLTKTKKKANLKIGNILFITDTVFAKQGAGVNTFLEQSVAFDNL